MAAGVIRDWPERLMQSAGIPAGSGRFMPDGLSGNRLINQQYFRSVRPAFNYDQRRDVHARTNAKTSA